MEFESTEKLQTIAYFKEELFDNDKKKCVTL